MRNYLSQGLIETQCKWSLYGVSNNVQFCLCSCKTKLFRTLLTEKCFDVVLPSVQFSGGLIQVNTPRC